MNATSIGLVCTGHDSNDAYLLALAVAHDMRFVTFDRALSLASVHGATDEHLLVL